MLVVFSALVHLRTTVKARHYFYRSTHGSRSASVSSTRRRKLKQRRCSGLVYVETFKTE